MRKLKLSTYKSIITIPKDSPRGIFHGFLTKRISIETLEEFEQTLIDDGTLSLDSPKLLSVIPELKIITESSKKRKVSSKSRKAKQRLIKKNSSQKINKKSNNKPKTMTKTMTEERHVEQKRASWRELPLYNVDRKKLTPRQYIENYWASHHGGRPQRYAYLYDTSLFNDEIKKLNLKNLWNPLDQTYYTMAKEAGVNRTMLMIAGSDTLFTWHNEDMDLASINYMHWGAPKYWVIVHRKFTDKFRKALIRDFASTELTPCKNPIKHKNYTTDLQWLEDNGIEYSIVSSIFRVVIRLLDIPNLF